MVRIDNLSLTGGSRRFRRQAMPLQTEIGKIHTPPGTLPWEPQYLLRPFKPTGEAAGDSQ